MQTKPEERERKESGGSDNAIRKQRSTNNAELAVRPRVVRSKVSGKHETKAFVMISHDTRATSISIVGRYWRLHATTA